MTRAAALIALVLIGTLTFASGCVEIEEGEVGVSQSFGSISDDPVEPGIAIHVPGIRTVETWNVELQEIEETVQVPSSEGLIVALDASLLFEVMADRAPQLHKMVGRSFKDRLIVPYLRNSVREIVRGYPVETICSEPGRREMAGKIEDFLSECLEPQGIRVEDVLLRDVILPNHFCESSAAVTTAESQDPPPAHSTGGFAAGRGSKTTASAPRP